MIPFIWKSRIRNNHQSMVIRLVGERSCRKKHVGLSPLRRGRILLWHSCKNSPTDGLKICALYDMQIITQKWLKFIYFCVCAHMQMDECSCMYVGTKGWSLVMVLKSCPLCSLRQGFSLAWSSPSRLGWPAHELQGSSYLCLSSTGMISTYHHASF